MKKVITAMLIAGMILSFASCGGNNEETTGATTTEATTEAIEGGEQITLDSVTE